MTNRSGTVEDKRKLAAFYTPSRISDLLCTWAIRSPHDLILEPSFGGCGFLEASKNRLSILGCDKPNLKLFGCDIDERAFQYLYDKIGPVELIGHFIYSDFLTLDRTCFAVKEFNVVVGNPPYISHHNMSKQQKETAIGMIQSKEIVLQGKASLWAYFLLHSLDFLRINGRMAWLLPGSFIHSDYSNIIRTLLKEKFRRVVALILGERLFLADGTEENTVILLADGWMSGPAKNGIELEYVSSGECLTQVVNDLVNDQWIGTELGGRSCFSLMTNKGRQHFEALLKHPQTIRLGELADIQIGIVTGRNKFFILNKEFISKLNLPNKAVKPILAKSNIAKGLSLSSRDLQQAKETNERCLLIDTLGMAEGDGPLQQYIKSFPDDLLNSIHTFKKRLVWHRPDDGKIPDAFFSYMNQFGPKLILNKAQTTSTNSVHRVFFKENHPQYFHKAVAISLLSTFSQLSAEIEGRSYGSGVLKHEPKETKRIALILPKLVDREKVEKFFSNIDQLLRDRKIHQAGEQADKFILESSPGFLKPGMIDVLKAELTQARARRHRMRKPTGK